MLNAVFTIVAKNYLAHARALMESVARADSSIARFVILVDRPDGEFDPADEPFTVVPSTALQIPESRWFHFKYNVLELSTAVKPYAARYLFDEFSIGKLAYLDPDIWVYRSLDEALFPRLDDSDVLLTPHLTQELDDGRVPDEQTMLRAGCYNLGFVGLRRSRTVDELLRWWGERLFDRCLVRLEDGYFVDQKWMDLAPSLFPNVGIVRDRTWNVAYWNLPARKVVVREGVPRVDDEPLLFFHFSGFDPRRPDVLSRHQNRYSPAKLADVSLLLREYRDRLMEHGFEECGSWPYSWGRFDDGTPIPDIARDVLRADPSLADRVQDPFSDSGKAAIVEAWNRPAAGAQTTELALAVHAADEEARRLFRDPAGADRDALSEWLRNHGEARHGLTEDLLPDPHALSRAPRNDPGEWVRRIAQSLPSLSPRLEEILAGRPPDGDALEEVFAYLNSTVVRRGRAPLTQLAQHILTHRPDVAKRFTRGDAIDDPGIYAWLLSYARREYALPERVVAPIREQWRSSLAEAPLLQSAGALWSRGLLALASRVASRDVPGAGLKPAPRTQLRRLPRMPTRKDRRTGRLGVNLLGYARAEMGVGEAARRSLLALETANVPVNVIPLSTGGTYPEGTPSRSANSGPVQPYDLIHVNADQLPIVVAGSLRSLHERQATIGYWAWEIEHFPERFHPAFRYCREIWTLSEFCRKAIQAHSPVPVHSFPPPVRRPTQRSRSRSDFGLSDDSYVFLAMADMLSVYERKNPLGAIDAFRLAHQKAPDSELIVKISSVDHNRLAMDELRAAAQGLPVRFLEGTLSREDTDRLISSCDCFVSLHRSEGFGLGIAEAMSAGKPVIVTRYSGNMEFTSEESSFLVDYAPAEIPVGCDPYPAGQVWAEPSIEHAARHMLAVQRDRERASTVAARGRADVERLLSPKRIGDRMRARLEGLYEQDFGSRRPPVSKLVGTSGLSGLPS